MDQAREIGLVCGYYLSRFDELAYKNLCFGNKQKTHSKLAKILNVPPNTIKNWRDEFDPIHENPRRGWHQRPMTPSRIRVVDACCQLSEFEVRNIVLELLKQPEGEIASELMYVFGGGERDTQASTIATMSSTRGITGHKAEKAFELFYSTTKMPVPGRLIDCRHEQCGYDYRIETSTDHCYVEVKGLSGRTGGLSFTNKEWQTALEYCEKYFLVIVRNTESTPEFELVKNPVKLINVRMQIHTVIQTSWTAQIHDNHSYS